VDVFGCTSCGAAATETVSDGGASIAVVRHQANCPVLASQVLARWPLHPAALPSTPPQAPFARWAGHRHALAVWEEQRKRTVR